MNIKLLSTLAVLTFSVISNAQTVQKQVKSLDNYIQDAIKVWNPPGLVVTVVKDGEIVFTKGYGITTLGENKPVDEHT